MRLPVRGLPLLARPAQQPRLAARGGCKCFVAGAGPEEEHLPAPRNKLPYHRQTEVFLGSQRGVLLEPGFLRGRLANLVNFDEKNSLPPGGKPLHVLRNPTLLQLAYPRNEADLRMRDPAALHVAGGACHARRNGMDND